MGALLTGLNEPQRRALDEAVTFVTERYAPWGIVVAGTIVRGEADPSSDLDLYVLHDAPFRQRVQRTFHGIAVEVFVNPESAVVGYFESEAREGRPVTAHMIATGVVLLGDGDERLHALRERASVCLETPPAWSDLELTQARYGAATLVEDALDRRDADPETAMRLLAQAMEATADYWFKRRAVHIPRSKEILSRIDHADPTLGRLLRDFWGDGPVSHRWAAALSIADRVLETRGFFEWESDRKEA